MRNFIVVVALAFMMGVVCDLSLTHRDGLSSAQKKYTAVGTVVGYSEGYHGAYEDEVVDNVMFETDDGAYFVIPFRRQPIVYKPGVEGSLHYHSCGSGVYCFDYWKQTPPARLF